MVVAMMAVHDDGAVLVMAIVCRYEADCGVSVWLSACMWLCPLSASLSLALALSLCVRVCVCFVPVMAGAAS